VILASGRGGARSSIRFRFAVTLQMALDDFDSPAAAQAKAGNDRALRLDLWENSGHNGSRQNSIPAQPG
jgi:hypothetical protein